MNVLGSRHHDQSQSRSTLTEHICIAKNVDSLAKTMTSLVAMLELLMLMVSSLPHMIDR